MTAQILDLTARRVRGEQAVARVAAAPVRHVPDAFLAALACVELDELRHVPSLPLPRAAR